MSGRGAVRSSGDRGDDNWSRFTRRVALAGFAGLSLLASAQQQPQVASSVPEPNVSSPLTVSVPASAKSPMADNSRCFVCHGNYDFEDEPLASIHAKANIGCVRCHGASPQHSADEDGLTPPERMYRPSHIRFNCLSCHDWVKLVASDKAKQDHADLKEKPDHQAVLDGTRKDKKLCTDCHGDHRLSHRTRRWDKRTGELVFRDKTPRLLNRSSTSSVTTHTNVQP